MSPSDLPPDLDFKRAIRRAFLLPLVMMGALALFLSWLVSHLFTVANWVDHSDQVVAQAHVCEKRVLDMETGLRGFQLTGEKQFLEPYTQAEPEVGVELSKLDQLVSDNAPQMERSKKIRVSWETWNEVRMAS